MARKRLAHTRLAKSPNFDRAYRESPARYWTELARLDYRLPEHTQRLARALIGSFEPRFWLDVGCSWGINQILVTRDVTLDELIAHYTGPDAGEGAWPGRLARWEHAEQVRRLGIDVYPEPIDYCRRLGLLHGSTVCDLNAAEWSGRARALIARADLITATGVWSYLDVTVWARLVELTPRAVLFGLAVDDTSVDLDEIAGTLPDTHQLIEAGPLLPQRLSKDGDVMARPVIIGPHELAPGLAVTVDAVASERTP
ncbi:MAG: hypothetical protein AAFZ07_19465 [Actinomycetota bacterium]